MEIKFKVVLPKMFPISEEDIKNELLETEQRMNVSSIMRFHLDEKSCRTAERVTESERGTKRIEYDDQPNVIATVNELLKEHGLVIDFDDPDEPKDGFEIIFIRKQNEEDKS